MTKDELQAWLLLAGFRLYKKYCYVSSYEGWYITVTFLGSGRIEISTLAGNRNFIRRRTAQKYIQELIGDRHADIPSVSRL